MVSQQEQLVGACVKLRREAAAVKEDVDETEAALVASPSRVQALRSMSTNATPSTAKRTSTLALALCSTTRRLVAAGRAQARISTWSLSTSSRLAACRPFRHYTTLQLDNPTRLRKALDRMRGRRSFSNNVNMHRVLSSVRRRCVRNLFDKSRVSSPRVGEMGPPAAATSGHGEARFHVVGLRGELRHITTLDHQMACSFKVSAKRSK
jgi:hypothetical protein